jgi:hypothetical protein
LAGAATGKRGTAIAAGAGFAVISYFIDSLAEITKVVRPWRVVSVFHQASATSALRGDLGIAGPLATAAVAAACFAVAMYLFRRRDLAVLPIYAERRNPDHARHEFCHGHAVVAAWGRSGSGCSITARVLRRDWS